MSAKPAEIYFRTYDAREMPRYTVGQVANYLNVPESTIRAWFFGMPYGKQPYIRQFAPVLRPAGKDLLSFFDAASAHVLSAFKAKAVPVADIRSIVETLRKRDPSDRYPLLGKNFYRLGKSVIIKEAGVRLNLSRGGQLGFRHIIDRFLRRIDLDEDKMPVRFSPIITTKKRARSYIVIDPNLSGGRPVVKGTGIAAEIIAKRRESGESIARLARDYRLSRRAIQAAVEYTEKMR